MTETDIGELANCPKCGKPTLGPIFSQIADNIGVSREVLLKVMRKKQGEGFRGFTCRNCTPKEVRVLWRAWADGFAGRSPP